MFMVLIKKKISKIVKIFRNQHNLGGYSHCFLSNTVKLFHFILLLDVSQKILRNLTCAVNLEFTPKSVELLTFHSIKPIKI